MPYIVRYLNSAPNSFPYWNREAAESDIRRRLGLPNGADIEPYRQADGSYQAVVRVDLITNE